MSQPTTLTAKYASPTNEAFAVDTPLPSATSSDKTSYLAALRTAVTDAQATINKELTARMEEDNKARDSSAGAAALDDAKEEENYGEEVQEEED
ncbi:Gon7 [Akanthomyces lecanii RCEF 1005]|uniref:EKC/KEOPS complex subunit GON7 n=1 Tax=Akanthomyces lecanii RCEF 1005 TaxID=1081108 RepID=A0A168IZ18_CORDF|nr:Gon7 [Akanthomyces lecanii RCEF 1005]